MVLYANRLSIKEADNIMLQTAIKNLQGEIENLKAEVANLKNQATQAALAPPTRTMAEWSHVGDKRDRPTTPLGGAPLTAGAMGRAAIQEQTEITRGRATSQRPQQRQGWEVELLASHRESDS